MMCVEPLGNNTRNTWVTRGLLEQHYRLQSLSKACAARTLPLCRGRMNFPIFFDTVTRRLRPSVARSALPSSVVC